MADSNRLLLVEDNLIAAEGMRMALEYSGFAVQVLHEGQSVVDTIAEWQPHIVILDVTLPDENGVHVAMKIRARWPRLPIVFTTGHDRFEGMERALAEERTAMLQKPFELSALLQEIDRWTSADGESLPAERGS